MITPLPSTTLEDVLTVTVLLPAIGLMVGFFLSFIIRSAVEIWNSPDDSAREEF